MPNYNYTYTPTMGGTNNFHRARRMLGDVGKRVDDAGNPIWLLSDEEIQTYIAEDFNEGVAVLCDGLISEFSHEPDRYEDESNVKIEWKNRLNGWRDLAKRLRLTPTGSPVMGGTPPPTALGAAMVDPVGASKLGV